MKLEDYEYQGRGVFFPPINMSTFIYKVIKKYSPINRTEIVKKTNIPRTTVFDNVEYLIRLRQVEKYKVNNHRKGRSKVYYKIIE